MSTITVYSKDQCVNCTATKRLMDQKGVEYTSVLLTNEEAMDIANSFSEKTGTTVAQMPIVTKTVGEEEDMLWSGKVNMRGIREVLTEQEAMAVA